MAGPQIGAMIPPGPQMGPQGPWPPAQGPWPNGQPGPNDPGPFHQMPNIILPGMNDSPLEFNVNKNKPPMPIENSNVKDETQKRDSPSDRSRRDRGKRDRDRERRDDKERRDDRDRRDDSERLRSENRDSQGPNGPSEGMGSQGGPMNPWTAGVMGMGYPVMGMNMIVDPNMMGMNNYGMMQPMMPDGTMIPPQVSSDFF